MDNTSWKTGIKCGNWRFLMYKLIFKTLLDTLKKILFYECLQYTNRQPSWSIYFVKNESNHSIDTYEYYYDSLLYLESKDC